MELKQQIGWQPDQIDLIEVLSGDVPQNALDYIQKYKSEAKQVQRDTGLDWMFIIAHSGIESGWGKHAPNFNFFGIKASSSWTGDRALLLTWEATKTGKLNLQAGAVSVRIYKPGETGNPFGSRYYGHRIKDWFRAYPNAKASFQDYAKLLQKPRYAEAWEYRTQPNEFGTRIMAAGYGTDPSYPSKLDGSLNWVRESQGLPPVFVDRSRRSTTTATPPAASAKGKFPIAAALVVTAGLGLLGWGIYESVNA